MLGIFFILVILISGFVAFCCEGWHLSFIGKFFDDSKPSSSRIPQVIDFCFFEYRGWGRDVGFMSSKDGWRHTICIFYTVLINQPSIEKGDLILWRRRCGQIVVATIEKVDRQYNPNDMYFLDINIKGARSLLVKHHPEIAQKIAEEENKNA